MVRRAALMAMTLALAACSGGSPVQSVAPTAETVAFLSVDPGALNGCIDVEQLAIDGVAGMITGAENGALAGAAQGGLARCRDVTRLIDVAGRPAAERPRAEACRRAFATKVEAYTALNRALSAEDDLMTAQSGLRAFLSGMRAGAPLMRTCNTPVA